ncbi:MAG: NAD(P)-dependent oxidoreductase [Nitrospina sp.]|jgi:UDP-glucose 4-epimerase|nr:NAD(P)-dependent oxidoreductase [Nitrospina sp.]
MSKNAIIFGGSGFLGSHVADNLSERGYNVTLFDIQPSPYIRPDQNMIVGDILDSGKVNNALKSQNVVFHFAGLSDLDKGTDQPLEVVNQNILGTINLLNGAVKNNVQRFVFASTIYVYSRLGGFYRCSKQATELFIEEFQNRYCLDYTVLRYGSLYGTRADDNNGIRSYLLQGLRDGKITYPGTGNEMREYINVKDAARLTVDILSPEYKNKHIVVTGHHPMKTIDMLEMIKEMLKKDITFEFSIKPNDSHYSITPYSFIPKVGSKLVSNLYVDMGQGFLECLQELSQDSNHHETTNKKI